MKHNRVDQREKCVTNTINNQKPAFIDSKRKVFLPKNPNWSVQYVVKFLRINGVIAKVNGKEILTLEKLKITVFDTKNSEQIIPKICRQESKRDVTRWLREVAGDTRLTMYLPSISTTTGQEMAGNIINVSCYYQASIKYNNGDTVGICCHPNFYNRGPRYDFVLQNHGNGNTMAEEGEFGKTTSEVTPSKLLVLNKIYL